MRRGAQVVAGRGYNKPPPGPMSHGGGSGRARLQSHDGSVPVLKDRFGSPRERSPSLGNVHPISPPHLINREKSPNPTSQDLHDCSMCLSAYIQSLNTVCGTACRLSQCLAQVGSEHGCSDPEGNQFLQLLKDAAEMWEGISRVIGIASTSVKNQMILLIQELQSRHNMDFADQIRKQEVSKVVRLMLSTFLSLHYQFSLIIVEKFSGVLQQLKEDSVGPSVYFADTVFKPSFNNSPNRPNTSSSNLCIQQQTSYNTINMSSPQLIQCQQQQQLLLQQQQFMLQQQMLQIAQHQLASTNLKASSINENSLLKEENLAGSRHSSGGSSIGLSGNNSYSSGWPVEQGKTANKQHPSLNSSLNDNATVCNVNTLSPGICSNLSSASGGSFSDWSTDILSRRWSMGGPTEESLQNERNSLTPFTLMANRRWSVPETTEHDITSASSMGGLHPLYGSCSGGDSNSVSGGQICSWGGAKSNGLLQISRESSCTRSPSHSRSVTPEQIKRVNALTNEEIDDVINLLSLAISPSSRKSSGSSSNSFDSGLAKTSCSTLDLNRKSLKHQRIPDGGIESQSQVLQNKASITESHALPLRTLTNHSSIDKNHQSCFKRSPWSSSRIDAKKPLTVMENEGKDDAANQISTALWPPTDSVPGVTLTECIGEEEKEDSSCWPDTGECVNTECVTHESINSTSWPSSPFARLSVMDDIGIGLSPSGQSEGMNKGWTHLPISTFRRHSTDAPYFLPMHNSLSLGFKTRSFENIAKVSELPNNKGSCLDSNIHRLLYLSSLNSPEASTANSQYSLFTTST